ncbi:hypothetical protein D6D25_02372 [Aureobasidium pullulans]|nr:hypothetical protein D6D25_02372 [Aureobasidium pullulans]
MRSYPTFNNAWLIRTKNNVGIVERPLNYARHIRLPTILWLLQRNLAIEECYKCVCQKGITPDLKAMNVHDALVVKRSNNMRQICYKSAYTRCNRLNRSYNGKVLLNDYEKKSYHHVGGISGHAQRTTEVAQRLYAKALYYTKYFGLDPKDFSQKNGILYFCEGFLMPENWSTSVAYAVCVDHACTVKPDDMDITTFTETRETFAEFLVLPTTHLALRSVTAAVSVLYGLTPAPWPWSLTPKLARHWWRPCHQTYRSQILVQQLFSDQADTLRYQC